MSQDVKQPETKTAVEQTPEFGRRFPPRSGFEDVGATENEASPTTLPRYPEFEDNPEQP
jgi:hypothetical protein